MAAGPGNVDPSSWVVDAAASNALLPLLGFVPVFSSGVVLIGVATRAKAALIRCLGAPTWFYFGILLVANFASGFVTFGIYHYRSAAGAEAIVEGFLRAFVAVFAINFVLGNMSMTLFGRKVIDIDGWIKSARDWATMAANQREDDAEQDEKRKIVAHLLEFDDGKLNARAIETLGSDGLKTIEQEAAANRADPRELKVRRIADSILRGKRARSGSAEKKAAVKKKPAAGAA